VTQSLWRALAARSVETPDAPLIIEADGSAYSYARSRALVTWWGARLRSISNAKRVVAVLPNIAGLYLLRLAAGQAGLPFVAVNPLLRGRTLADALLRTSVSDLIVSADTADLVGEVAGLLPVPVRIHVLDGDELILSGGGVAEGVQPFGQGADPDHAVVIVYTSGTSGPAKPVLLSANVLHLYGGTLFDDQDRTWPNGAGYYSPWHPAHILGAVALDAAVRRNLVLVIRRKFDLAAFWEDVRGYDCRLTVLISVAAQLWAARQPEQRDNPLELVGMSPLIPAFGAFERYFEVQALSIYGMTEVGTVLVARSPRNSSITGYPVPGYACRLEAVPDLETRRGNVGELAVRPAVRTSEYELAGGVMTGGWIDGWFHTGDLFVEQDGYYSFIGRIKDCIRRRGRNISAADLEAQILEIPEVFDCACVGISEGNAGWGDDDEIRLFIQATIDAKLDLPALAEQLSSRLPSFMLPRYFDIVTELPRTASGKVARGALRQIPIRPDTYDRKEPRTGQGRTSSAASPKRLIPSGSRSVG
jgi:carnitine-CoA ligase